MNILAKFFITTLPASTVLLNEQTETIKAINFLYGLGQNGIYYKVYNLNGHEVCHGSAATPCNLGYQMDQGRSFSSNCIPLGAIYNSGVNAYFFD